MAHVTELLHNDFIKTGSQAEDKESVLHEIAGLALKSEELQGQSGETVFRALKHREDLSTTGFGNGIAIPHCRLAGIREFVVGLVVIPKGAEFNALDGKKVQVAFFIIAPEDRRNEHIHLLSSVSRVLHQGAAVSEILKSSNPEKVREVFFKNTQAGAGIKEQVESCALNVFVQGEEIFYDILQILSETEAVSLSVVEGNDASHYLSKMPLFASFWEKKPRGFHRIILAIVKKNMCNDILRQIHLLENGDDKRQSFLVTVQDLAYTSGSLYL